MFVISKSWRHSRRMIRNKVRLAGRYRHRIYPLHQPTLHHPYHEGTLLAISDSKDNHHHSGLLHTHRKLHQVIFPNDSKESCYREAESSTCMYLMQ